MNQRNLDADQKLTLQIFWRHCFNQPGICSVPGKRDPSLRTGSSHIKKKKLYFMMKKAMIKEWKKYCKFWMLGAMIMWVINSQVTESTAHFSIIYHACWSSGGFILLNKCKVFSTTEMQNMTLWSINLKDLAFSKGRFTKTNNNCKFLGNRDIA